MSAPEPEDIWREVLAWLRVAASDQRMARVGVTLEPPSLDAAAFHCQQAAEKLMKGFLVQASVDFGKTHDLERLGRVVASHFPSVTSLVSAMNDWTDWNIAYRYPDFAAAEPEPSVEELSVALDLIARLDAALRSLAPSNDPSDP